MAKSQDYNTIDLDIYRDSYNIISEANEKSLLQCLIDLNSSACQVKNILDLYKNEIPIVFKGLKANKHIITSLKVSINTYLQDKGDTAQEVIQLLKDNNTLTKLDVSGCSLEATWIFKELNLNFTLKTLNFSENYNSWNNGGRYEKGINSAIKSLADLLKTNTALTSVNMSKCIGEPQRAQSDFDALKDALKNNHKILHLDISNNKNVTDEDLFFVSNIIARNQDEAKTIGDIDEAISNTFDHL